MLQNIRKSRGGFTLVEIMIVVAIIALLAAIAVPGFLRARKRSQATAILNDLRVLDGAKDQYAIENNKKGGDTVKMQMLTPYLKPGTRLYVQTDGNATTKITDPFGKDITIATFDNSPLIDNTTRDEFSSGTNPVIDSAKAFWGSYCN